MSYKGDWYAVNLMGPSTDPCGTPNNIYEGDEDEPFTWIF
jgi:hypothetical protein